MATVRALKMNGGVGRVVAGKPLDPALLENNPDGVRRGGVNLAKQIENVRAFGVPAVVAINVFPTDTADEIEAIREVSLAAGARDAVVARHFTDGGAGAEDLARAVWAAAEEGAPDFHLLYPDEMPPQGQDRDDRDPDLRRRRRGLPPGRGEEPRAVRGHGLRPPADLHGEDPVQPVATTRSSWVAPPGSGCRSARSASSAGAGFVTPIAGDMRTMPGLN